MAAYREIAARTLSSSPRLFDSVKRVTRALGDRSPVYEFLRDFNREYPHCRFLQIGSNDGIRHDPLREFIVRGKWTGILVEPVLEVFERLRRNYPRREGLHFVNAAVSSEVGVLPFYAVRNTDDGVPHDADMLGSFDRGHLVRHMGEDLVAECVVKIHVPVLTVAVLLEDHGFDGVDLLHIDAEGHEAEIIGSIDFDTVHPAAVIYESRHLDGDAEAVDGIFAAAGYKIREVGMDSIATPNAHRHRAPAII